MHLAIKLNSINHFTPVSFKGAAVVMNFYTGHFSDNKVSNL
jgi:hypothetical protein